MCKSVGNKNLKTKFEPDKEEVIGQRYLHSKIYNFSSSPNIRMIRSQTYKKKNDILHAWQRLKRTKNFSSSTLMVRPLRKTCV
jgi:hypothetical protein